MYAHTVFPYLPLSIISFIINVSYIFYFFHLYNLYILIVFVSTFVPYILSVFLEIFGILVLKNFLWLFLCEKIERYLCASRDSVDIFFFRFLEAHNVTSLVSDVISPRACPFVRFLSSYV